MNCLPNPVRVFLCYSWLALCLIGCVNSGPSAAHIERLGELIDEIDRNYSDLDAKLADGSMKQGPLLLTAMEAQELELVDKYLRKPDWPLEIREHLESWREGLKALLPIHRELAEAEQTFEDAPPAKQSRINELLMQTTQAETALRIIAGR